MISLTVFVSLLFFYSLISQRLERTIITALVPCRYDLYRSATTGYMGL